MAEKKKKKNAPKTKRPRWQKKAPRVSHTKGYYRFSKDFPSVTDSDGYRDNDVIVNSPAKKASVRRRLTVIFVCVFFLAFVGTLLSFTISHYPIAVSSEPSSSDEQAARLAGYRAVYLSGETLSFSSAQGLISELKLLGANAAVIVFKDASGYFYYPPSSVSVSADALFKTSDRAEKVIAELREAGIAVFASFSCFADDIYARNHQEEAAYVLTVPESGSYDAVKSLWYDEEEAHAWLSPYSDEVLFYLRMAMKDIAALNVDGILLENAVLPVSAQKESVIFSGQPENEADADAEMADFIASVTTEISCRTACLIPSDVVLNAIAQGTLPEILYAGTDAAAIDVRLSRIPDDTVIGNKMYKTASLSPVEFLQDYLGAFSRLLSESEQAPALVPVIDASDSSSQQIETLRRLQMDSFIMFHDDFEYKTDYFS